METKLTKEEANKIVSDNILQANTLIEKASELIKASQKLAGEHALEFKVELGIFSNFDGERCLEFKGDGLESDGSYYGRWSNSGFQCMDNS